MEDCIKITHFVNPHRFWFRRPQSHLNRRVELHLQVAINSYCIEHYGAAETGFDGYYEPVDGEMVAVYDPDQKRWARARVVDTTIAGSKNIRHTYQVWCLDEGVPKEADARHMKMLPTKFIDTRNVSVKRGAVVNIVPKQSHAKCPSPEWDAFMNVELQGLVQSAERTYFRNMHTLNINGEEIQFGELSFITKTGKEVAATDFLMNLDGRNAMIVDEERFIEYMILNSRSTEAHIPVKITTINENASVGTCVQKRPIFPAGMAEPQLSAKAATKSHVKPAKLERVSREQPAAKSVSVQTIYDQFPRADIRGMSAVVSPRDKVRIPLPRDLGPIDHKVFECSLSLERYNKARAEKHDPSRPPNALPRTTIESPKLEPCQTPSEEENSIQKKLARLYRVRSNPTKPTADETQTKATVSSSTVKSKSTADETQTKAMVVAQATDSSLGAMNAGTKEQILPTSEAAEFFPVNVLPTGKKESKFERVLREQYCAELTNLRYHRMLVHGLHVPMPIESITKANFTQGVHDQLYQLGIRLVYRLQAYAWPHIMRGNSVLCVNSPGTGKTFAYLPAVCSLIKMRTEEKLVRPGAGPVGIIVCHSSKEVQLIGNLCRMMLSSPGQQQMTVIVCYGVRLVQQVCNKLWNGCSLLVTTAAAYRRLHDEMHEAFVRERIQIVVFDHVERMLQHFAADVQLLCRNCDPNLQLIVTSDYWDRALGAFLSRYKNMIVCIGAYLEAAVYAKVQFQLRLLRNDGSKQNELVRFIREHDYRSQRTIVFASTGDDLDLIVTTLRLHSIEHLVCSVGSTLNERDSCNRWDDSMPGEMEVLVCLDELLGDLRVSKAQHIVHYSLPGSWTRFTRRFATSFHYYCVPVQKSDEKPETRPSALVLLDEDNNQELPKLIDFLELHHVQFPKELSVLARNIRQSAEHVRATNGTAVCELCPLLLALTECRSIRPCIYRHALMESDFTFGDSLPPCGTVVRLHIFHVLSPVHFAGRIEWNGAGYGASSWKPPHNPREFVPYNIHLQAYFANADRHQMYGKKVKPNELCAFFYEQNYWRCRIIHFQPEGESTTVGAVHLKLIDNGRIVSTRTANLLSLPEQFHALPDQAIDVRIAGIVPLDFEEEWDTVASQQVQRWIDDHVKQPHHYVQGKVMLALRGKIWIDDLVLIEQLERFKTVVVSKKIKPSIVTKQFGVNDSGSFERIQQIVQKFETARGTDVEPVETPLPTVPESTTPRQPEDQTSTIPSSSSIESDQRQEQNDAQNELPVERSLGSVSVASKHSSDGCVGEQMPNHVSKEAPLSKGPGCAAVTGKEMDPVDDPLSNQVSENVPLSKSTDCGAVTGKQMKAVDDPLSNQVSENVPLSKSTDCAAVTGKEMDPVDDLLSNQVSENVPLSKSTDCAAVTGKEMDPVDDLLSNQVSENVPLSKSTDCAAVTGKEMDPVIDDPLSNQVAENVPLSKSTDCAAVTGKEMDPVDDPLSNQVSENVPLAKSTGSTAATGKQRKAVDDPVPHQDSDWAPLTTSSGRQTPMDSNEKNNSISSTSSFEILSPTRDNEAYRFDSLEKGKQHYVLIGQYFAPDLFYVYKLDAMFQIDMKIKECTADASKLKQLVRHEVGVYCLMYYEETYRRSRIVEVVEKEKEEDKLMKLFLLDFGGTIWSYRESLFEIPDHLLRAYPFGAIEAKLACIEPLEGSTWPEETSDAIYDVVLAKYNNSGMVAHVLATLEPRSETDVANLPIEGCPRYELLLSEPDCTNMYSIVCEIVEHNLAMVNHQDNHQLDQIHHREEQVHRQEDQVSVSDNQSTPGEDDQYRSFVMLDFTEDELKDILHKIIKKQPEAVSAVASAAAIEQKKDTPLGTGRSSPACKVLKEKTTDRTIAAAAGRGRTKSKSYTTAALPRLECAYRFPPTVWWQDDSFITLHVSAPDVSHYQLTVHARSLLLQYIRDDERYQLPLNLFGPIDPERTTHEVRGLSIVIRLARLRGSTWRWPTLLNHTGKLPWLRKAVRAPRRRRTCSDGSSGSESGDEYEVDWNDFLPTKLDEALDFPSQDEQEDQYDDMELQLEGAMEDEIFYR